MGQFKTYVKMLARSGSLRFTNSYFDPTPDLHVESIQIDGKPFYYRTGSSDQGVAYSILMKRSKPEYLIPEVFTPRRILDIGANIGAASRYFLRQYPDADLFCFEPVKSNFDLLQQNLAEFPKTQCFNIGLGSKTETIKLLHSDSATNFGGFSRFGEGVTAERGTDVNIVCASEFFTQHSVGKVDLIKIDTEGAEYNILTAMPESLISNTDWIVGELHGEDDFKLLDFLSSRFDIGINKRLGKRLSMFYARNKTLPRPSLNN